VLVSVQLLPDGTSKLQLDRPLQYTHLGVLRSYAGDPGRHVLAMHAEVAVLDRNIVIQVGWCCYCSCDDFDLSMLAVVWHAAYSAGRLSR
jgi:hypothetical protein